MRETLITLLVDQRRQTALPHWSTRECHWLGVLTISTNHLHTLLQNKISLMDMRPCMWTVYCTAKGRNHCNENDDDSILSTNWFEETWVVHSSMDFKYERGTWSFFAMGDL